MSQSTLKALGVIPANFPQANSFEETRNSMANATATRTKHPRAKCGCLARQPPQEHPGEIPFPPTMDNRPKLEAWIKNHFADSAFNTCTHQRLQAMSGKPLEIAFKEGYILSAVHFPIPVAHQWKKEVKQAIDADVRLGIIEPVPVGTPTEWCSQMVVSTKSDGSPRRTVDLQKLNVSTIRKLTTHLHSTR